MCSVVRRLTNDINFLFEVNPLFNGFTERFSCFSDENTTVNPLVVTFTVIAGVYFIV
jgi:hypothetical protein